MNTALSRNRLFTASRALSQSRAQPVREHQRRPSSQSQRSQRPRRSCKVYAAQPPSQIQADKLKAHGAVFTVQVVFALWYIVGHSVLSDHDPLTFALLRELLSACALLGIAQAVEGDFSIKSRQDGFTILALGGLCYAVVMGFMFALSDVPEVQVAIAQPLVPALALGMSALLGTEVLSFVAGGGILLSIIGAVSFTYFNASGGGGASMGHAFGYSALAIELLAYAGQMVLLPRISKQYGTVTLTSMYYTVASVATAGTLVAREHDDLGQLVTQLHSFADPQLTGALAFAVLGPTVFAFSALSYSSQKLKPSINSSYITLQPMLVAIVSLVLFGTTLSSQEVGSGVIVLAGLYLSIIGNPQVDRAWSEYVQDLPTNVPQTIATVADAGVDAAVAVGNVTVDAAAAVGDKVIDLGSDVRGKLDNVLSSDESGSDQAFERRMDEVFDSRDSNDSTNLDKERVH